MEGRLERKCRMVEDIIAWSHGAYDRNELQKMTMDKLGEIYSKVYFNRIREIQTIKL